MSVITAREPPVLLAPVRGHRENMYICLSLVVSFSSLVSFYMPVSRRRRLTTCHVMSFWSLQEVDDVEAMSYYVVFVHVISFHVFWSFQECHRSRRWKAQRSYHVICVMSCKFISCILDADDVVICHFMFVLCLLFQECHHRRKWTMWSCHDSLCPVMPFYFFLLSGMPSQKEVDDVEVMSTDSSSSSSSDSQWENLFVIHLFVSYYTFCHVIHLFISFYTSLQVMLSWHVLIINIFSSLVILSWQVLVSGYRFMTHDKLRYIIMTLLRYCVMTSSRVLRYILALIPRQWSAL